MKDSDEGGAIFAESVARVEINVCTFERNRAAGFGGAIYHLATNPSASVEVLHCTVVGNVASNAGGGILMTQQSPNPPVSGKALRFVSEHTTLGKP